ncbi:hypothetical protein [Pseudomonas sp. HS6]|uniref:hypothetical protein n=1 Tax=Pseudomonas sp. HS6 TaxID=2850559 RepID=UPI002019BDB5|nr:hypothetical protein [Pseudomonas sp. HS6]UQS17582.1 hypothetical protein JJN09_12200 [Pseudomonas sp. HS6]
MPRWLFTLMQVLGEGQPEVLHQRMYRFDEPQSLRRVHRWHADVVLPMLCEALPEHRPALLALQSLHQRAALGLSGRQGEWRATLKPVLLALYRRAYAYETAYAQAHASAMTYGLAPTNTVMIAEHFGDAEAFAVYYAQLNTEASATAFAQAHAAANAEISSRAFATDDADAYAQVCAASARVCVWACAQTDEQRNVLFNRLAEGLIQHLPALQSHSTGERHE